MVERIDQDRQVLVSYDEREVAYDQLVTIPLNMGADFVARSGLGDELNYVAGRQAHDAVHRAPARSGPSATRATCPPRRPGSVAHFSVEVFVENFLEHAAGRPMTHSFDGHANCFVESGPRQGAAPRLQLRHRAADRHFPFPKVGPMTLLGESRANHLGKLAFRHVYWNALLPGRPLGLRPQMSMAGKNPA